MAHATVAATPQTVGIIKLGYAVVVESGAGVASSFSDAAYVDAGAEIGQAWTPTSSRVSFEPDAQLSSSSSGSVSSGAISRVAIPPSRP